MIKFSTIRTYTLLVQALTSDFRVQKTIQTRIQQRTSLVAALNRDHSQWMKRGWPRYKNSSTSTLVVVVRICDLRQRQLPTSLEVDHSLLLQCCAYRGNAAQAALFSLSSKGGKTSSQRQWLTNTGEIKGAEQVFTEHRKICRSRSERLSCAPLMTRDAGIK